MLSCIIKHKTFFDSDYSNNYDFMNEQFKFHAQLSQNKMFK